MGIRDGEEKVIISQVNHLKEKNKRCGSHIKAVNHSWKMLKCGSGLHWGAPAFVFIESFAMAIMQDNDKVERRNNNVDG